jgi:hypothetical protein
MIYVQIVIDKEESLKYEHGGTIMGNKMTDNVKAIEMLKNITDLLRAIEYNDVTYIYKNLENLKSNLVDFEKVFYLNLGSGIYKQD